MQTQQSDLTDFQWQIIEHYLKDNKPRSLCLRSVTNAILWVTRTGVQWRNLDYRFPKWESVYYYFRKWTLNGTFELIMSCFSAIDRLLNSREEFPSLIAVDSQSIKLAPFMNLSRGIDGGKKINGRKRHIAVDIEGRLFAIHVGPANQHDGDAGQELLPKIDKISSRLQLIKGDTSYGGVFTKSANIFGWKTDTTQNPPSKDKGFVPQACRWQVERSFGWLNFYRRLSKDYERDPRSEESFIALAYCNMILARFEKY